MDRLRVLAVLSVLAVTSGCASPYYRDRAAGLGAITGALAGAAIGDHNGNALAGTAIGAAVGGLTGSVVGESMDAEIARNQALVEQSMGRPMDGAATVSDVIQMTQAGLSESVILTHVQTQGLAQPLEVPDLIALRHAQVSDMVITAMQQQPQRVVRAAEPAPIVIEEHYYVPPPPIFIRRPPPPCRIGPSIGVGFHFD